MTTDRPANDDLHALLAASALGDRAAFARLYRATAPKLFPLALRILKSRGLAEECLQDAYVKVWQHAADYRPQVAAPLTWMVSILRNRALDLLRRNRREQVLDDPEQLVPLLDLIQQRDGDPNEPATGLDEPDRRALLACLEVLREDQRQGLLLAYFEGLTHAEVAARMNIALGTIKSWIRRGLEQLKRCLDT
ncbi:MAG: sigma-70 family RNA polymerase sigma factor [Ectothiorhodospiraceae bacterium]|nr:sigma-70 family RNA polymerase sigma factor [Ectothiorhodospiraceae bacterium]